MVDRLLAAGASPGLQDYRGCNALHSAAQGGHSSVFARLHEVPPLSPALHSVSSCSPMSEFQALRVLEYDCISTWR